MGNLAAAWYDPEARKVQVLEDTKDTLNWDLVCLGKLFVRWHGDIHYNTNLAFSH